MFLVKPGFQPLLQHKELHSHLVPIFSAVLLTKLQKQANSTWAKPLRSAVLSTVTLVPHLGEMVPLFLSLVPV